MSVPVDRARVRALFEAACDRPRDQRPAFIKQATAGDPALREEVESLLRFDSVDDDLLSENGLKSIPLRGDTDEPEDDGPAPDRIGAYRIIRRIGAGGMGYVYEAEQASPRRRVALKVVRPGRGTSAISRRFAREGQIQSRLSHPGIAAVYETGVDKDSSGETRPYFAMELVEGVPLLDYIARSPLDRHRRLAIIADICDAVSYAHQRGVVHRDLKPDNIFVQEIDGKPHPKILDFGIAKLLEQDLRAATMQTEVGQLLGTLSYMSPEQLRGRADEIDTRTDIYALGLILYQVLAGRACFQTENMPLAEAIRAISDQEPARLGSIDPSLRGDVETIVHKAIARDKSHRYASASEFAADIRHSLNDEPISARPATLLYQTTRFARRHRALVSVAALALATLVAAVIATTLFAISARRDRDKAEQKTDVAEGVSQTLLSAFTTATPKGSPGKEPRLIDAIAKIESQVEAENTSSSPEVRAVVLNIVGIIYRERGDLAAAERNFLKALEIRRAVLAPDDPNIADSLNNMGLLRKRQERYAEAAAYYQQAVDLQRRSSFHDDSRLARNIYNLASAYISAGELEKAKPLLEESLVMHRRLRRENDETIGFHISAQARIARAENRWSDARSLAEKALALQREAVGPSHPSIITALADLAAIVSHEGDPARGLLLLREADSMARAVFSSSPAHPQVQDIRARLLAALRDAGKNDEASQLERDDHAGK